MIIDLGAVARRSPVLLVTGVGAFPGAQKNPTQGLMQALGMHERRLRRLGLRLERRILPVVYAEIAPRLKTLIDEIDPDAILHFGLAGRRSAISIETRAVNRLNTWHPDAMGRLSVERHILPGSLHLRASKLPAPSLYMLLRRAGFPSQLSIDAGDYVCNQTFYLSLAMAEGTRRQVGFVHVPKRSVAELTQAALRLIVALIPVLRRVT